MITMSVIVLIELDQFYQYNPISSAIDIVKMIKYADKNCGILKGIMSMYSEIYMLLLSQATVLENKGSDGSNII